MTNWLLIAGLGLGAYYLYSQSQVPNLARSLDPLDPGVPIQLLPSANGDTYQVPISVVKQYNTPDQTSAPVIYVPTPHFSTMPVTNPLS
jgi:hypothetical protein